MAVDKAKFTHTLEGPRVVQENSTFPLTVTYFAAGVVTAPGASTSYKVVNPKTGRVLAGWTTAGAAATSETITVTAAHNTLQTQGQGPRQRELFVKDSSDNLLGSFKWAVLDTESDAT